MEFKGIRILVLDGFCRQVAVILKELHKMGCVITTLNDSKLDIGFASRYPKKKLIDKKFKGDTKYYEKLIFELCESGEYDIVFPIIEESTEILSRNYDVLSKKIKVIAPPYKAYLMASDKQKTMELCMANGINCPRTKKDSETLEEFLKCVKFPLACKPRVGRGSVGFLKVNNKEELDKLLKKGTIKLEEYVIQEFIPQGEIHRVSYTFVDSDGEVKSSMISKSSRPYPLEIGTNSLFESVDMPEIRKQSEKLLSLFGWQGYASVCFIESKFDGVPKVMEINARISASFKISVISGCKIIQQLIERAYGVPAIKTEKVLFGCRVKHSQSSFLWFLKSKERFRKESNKRENHITKDVVYSFSDPWPYFAYSLQCLGKYKKEMKKRDRKIS